MAVLLGRVEERPRGRGRTCLTRTAKRWLYGEGRIFRRAPFRIVDAPLHAYVLYLCCPHECVRPREASPAADRVYAHVKQGVLERTYEGGTLLTEGELAEAVGVSRTPVREALLRLEAEGLIKLYPKKGALVLPVSAQEIADVVETRLLVEEHAARKAVPAPPVSSRASRSCSRARRRRRPPATSPRPPSPTGASTPRSSAAAATRSSPASTTSCATVSCAWARP